MGTARTQGGRSSLSASSVRSGTSEARVGRRKEGSAGSAAGEEERRSEEDDAVGRLVRLRAKIWEGEMSEM